MSTMRVKKLRENAMIPTYGSVEAAGADLYACLDEPVTVAPGATVWIPTGLAMEIPKGCAGLVYARSGLACKQDLAPANKVGVIDSDYRGEICVGLLNTSKEPFVVERGDRIAQMMFMPVYQAKFLEATSLDETARGAGGFGSTGVAPRARGGDPLCRKVRRFPLGG